MGSATRLGHGAVAVGMVLADGRGALAMSWRIGDGRGAVAMGVVLSRWAWCSRDELALPPVFGGDPGAMCVNLCSSTTPIKSSIWSSLMPMVSALTISALEALEWRAIAT